MSVPIVGTRLDPQGQGNVPHNAHSTGPCDDTAPFSRYEMEPIRSAICNVHCSTSKSSGIALARGRREGSNEDSTSITVHTESSGLLDVVKLSTPPVGIGIAIRQCPSLYVRSKPRACGARGAGMSPRHVAIVKPHGRKWHATDTHLNI